MPFPRSGGYGLIGCGLALGALGTALSILNRIHRWHVLLIALGSLLAGWGIAAASPPLWRKPALRYMAWITLPVAAAAYLLMRPLPS